MPRKIIRACTAHHSNNDESQKVRYNSFFIVGVEEAFNRSMICSLYLLYVRMTMVTCLTRTYSHTDTHTVLYTISSHSSCIRIAKSVKVLKVTHSFTHRIVRHFVTLDFVRWQRHCRMRHKCQSRWWADLKRNITYFACFSICIFSLCLQMYKVGCRIAAATAAYMQIFEVWFATVKLALHMGKQRKRPIAKLFAVCVCFFPIRICLALHYNRHNVNISEHDECECMCMALRPENIYL